jgi:acetylornithine deacetylase/succinyl-diaminopimelate desuccinylase-like protein
LTHPGPGERQRRRDKAQNVIPPTATANLGVRLVAGDDPQRMLDLVEAHVRRQGFHLVRERADLETRRAHPKLAAFRARRRLPGGAHGDGPAGRARASSRRPTRAAGGEPVLLPAWAARCRSTSSPTGWASRASIVPVANHDNNQHAPDENLRLANLWYAIDLYGALLTMP